MKKTNVLSLIIAITLLVPLATFAASPATVNLGSANNYAILAKTGVSTTGTTAIVGDVGVSPAEASYITGFALILPSASAFSTSALVTGKVYAPGYANPTPTALTTAVLNMQTAYTDAMGRAPTVTELGAGNIGGLTLVSGVYKWGTGVTIPSNITLSGSANDVWIFQIAQNLTVSSGVHIVLAGGAKASNIFWVVAGQTTIGTTAVMNGNILDQTAIVLNTGATLNGRALAQTAVTLDGNAVTLPSSSAPIATVTPTPTPVVTPATTPTTSSGATTTPVGAESTETTVQSQTTTTVQPVQSTQTVVTTAPSLSASQVQSILGVLASFNADASTITKVRTSLSGGTNTGSVTSSAVPVFKTNLTIGSLGSEVKALQMFLNSHGYPVSMNGAGSPGNETTKFGSATRTALVKYQKANGITPASGYFGPLTRAKINAQN